jgi:DNA polymerase-3 subunit epsilon
MFKKKSSSSLKQERFICIDVETTGLNIEEDRIIEVAAVRFSIEEGVLESFETLIDPVRAIPEEATAIHKISSSMLKGKPTAEVIMPKLLDFVGNDVIIGHQITFDIGMIVSAAKRMNLATDLEKRAFIDTLRLARSYGDSPNNSLSQLAKHFNVAFEESHRAMSDVLMNIEVFKYLVHRYNCVSEVFKLLSRPIKMKYMPLGKYKGRLFSEIPFSYLTWAANMQFDSDLLYSIRTEIKKRKTNPGFSEASNPFKQL